MEKIYDPIKRNFLQYLPMMNIGNLLDTVGMFESNTLILRLFWGGTNGIFEITKHLFKVYLYESSSKPD